jgi:hypothetical protein
MRTRSQTKKLEHQYYIRGFCKNPFVSIGMYYGYPICCIKNFVRNILCKEKKASRIQKRVSRNCGFIPCSYCSWKILTKQIKIEDLIKNRICENPFIIQKRINL